ncbi:hypothetical protein GCM10010272_10440 [Streptomyces lateritius]|nr:hypothetical protein GCM10010272_10440 [Streptomyces lateritius]
MGGMAASIPTWFRVTLRAAGRRIYYADGMGSQTPGRKPGENPARSRHCEPGPEPRAG